MQMVKEDVAKEVVSIISDVSGVDVKDIKAESNIMNDLDVDSIKTIEITVAIEKKFGISVRDEDVPNIITVKDAIEITEKLIEKRVNQHVK